MASVAAPGSLGPPSPGRGRGPRPPAAPGDDQLTPARAGDSSQKETAEQLEVINEEDLPVKVCEIKLMQDVLAKELEGAVSVSTKQSMIEMETTIQPEDLQVRTWNLSTTFCGGWLAVGEGQLWTLEVIVLRTNKAD
jgi:hypothetical protein